MIIKLADGADERLTSYTRLTDMTLRRRLETQRGLYTAESSKVVTHTVATGHAPCSLLMAPRHLEKIRPVIASAAGCGGSDDGSEVPVFVAPKEVLESITGFHLHRGALAAMNRPELAGVPELLSSAHGEAEAKRVAILEDLMDHTNVRAAFRNAVVLGIGAVLVTPCCADPLCRRNVRVSMGTVFQVPWTRIERWLVVDELHAQGFTMATLTLSDASVALDEFAVSPACTVPDSRIAVVLGTEGDRLSHRAITAADEVMRIPMAGGVDLLNATVAAVVAFWVLRLP